MSQKSSIPLPRILVKVKVEVHKRLFEETGDRVMGIVPTEEHTERLLEPCVLYLRMKERGMVIERVEFNEEDETKLDLYITARGDTTREFILHAVGALKLETTLGEETFLVVTEDEPE